MRSRLRLVDYEALVDLAVALLDTRSSVAAHQQMTAQINESLRGRIAVFATGIHPASPHSARAKGIAPAPLGQSLGERSTLRRDHLPNNPLVEHFIRTGDKQPRAQQDIVDSRIWQRNPTYAFVRETTGATHHLVVPIPSAAPGLTSLWVARDSAFRTRELEFCRRVVPIMTSVDRHLAVLASVPRDGPQTDGITPRELAVLELLSQGLTAAAIGRRLAISPHTVTKHQSNLYRKFGTNDRLTTVLEASRRGLIAP